MNIPLFRQVACVLLLAAGVACGADNTPASLIAAGHFKQARTLLEKRIAENPKDADTLVLLARVRLAYQEHEEASRLLLQALAIQPEHSDAHLYMAEMYSQKVDHVGVFEKAGVAKKIRFEAERALAANPRNIDALETLLDFHLEAPRMVGGDKGKAAELAEKIARLDPVRGYFAKAEIAAKEKHHDRQEALLEQAVIADPQSYAALVAAADLYLTGLYAKDRTLSYAKATDYARKALAVDDGRVRAYATLAEAYAAQQQWAQLEDTLAAADKAVPDDASPYFRAGNALLVTGRQPARAETYFRKYLSQEPEGEAPTQAVAHWRLGLALEKQGRKAEAIQEIQMAVKMKPGLKEAKKDLDRLKG